MYNAIVKEGVSHARYFDRTLLYMTKTDFTHIEVYVDDAIRNNDIRVVVGNWLKGLASDVAND